MILADGRGGVGSYTSDIMATSRNGLFCAVFYCSNNRSVQKARDFFRFQKEQCWLCIKKDKRSGGHQVYLN